MKKSLYRVLVVTLLAAVAAPASSLAGNEFASPFHRKQAERKAKGMVTGERSKRKKSVLFQWWLDDARGEDDVKLKRAVQRELAADVDPEPLPGFGMGNIPYVLPKLQPVLDKAAAQMTAASTEAESIRLVMADADTPIRASADITKTVTEHYKATGFKPLWTADGKLTARGQELVKVLAASGDEGLVPFRYLPRSLSGFDSIDQQIEGSSISAAQIDVGLTVAALTYANDLTGGAFEPNKLSKYHDIKTEALKPEVALKVLAFSPFPKAYLDGLAPKHPSYMAMKAELAKLRATPLNETPFPDGKRIRIGQKDSRIPELRGRLVRLGFLDDATPMAEDSDPEVLDKHVGRALKAFQAERGIAQTSALDPATVKAFNGNTPAGNIRKLQINMERARWLPKDMGSKHVFVNQAAYEVDVFDGQNKVWESKVIVGKPLTQTVAFSDVMENVVFNPPWGMPQSILINEYLGKLRRDPGYFDKIGYRVTNSQGKRVSSRSVNWHAVSARSGIGVQQPPGDSNALGYLKFNFPNSHAIYMHDTPNRELFSESRRNFSHGCVRVQNPRDFAAMLLGLTRAEVDAKIATGNSFTVPISQHIPVHLTYFTAWPADDGKIHYYADAYGRDETLDRAFDVVAKAFTPNEGVKVVEASGTAAQ